MTFLFLLVCSVVLIITVASIVFLGTYLLGRPLSRGCGKTDCCHKKHCDTANSKPYQSDNHDDNPSPQSKL
ncbi:hypothetical protein CP10139811_0995 [Chlamydia ibidis]|uniref:Uncharacterized protein n=2 Tax=Chlamydia ibidis TaxID=1405396 RepID=S7J4M2_9CHLA|nr:hypothetical protein [Chlamydia ibidis]EPP35354.1 hypothetical protein CP10139811_0995 [Chlamydia ibidis]EQM63048.1 hypothetical protein H359_0313 [Chlamydia ibidis 10-1398/6]